MGTTDANGIYFYEDTDAVSPLHTLLNLGQTSVSGALNAAVNRHNPYIRNIPVTASGTLSTTDFDIAPAQTIPANNFPFNDYAVRIKASIAVQIPSGLGAELILLFDGAEQERYTATNGGGQTTTYTLQIDRTIMTSDAANHTIRVIAHGMAGSVTMLANSARTFEIQAQQYVML